MNPIIAVLSRFLQKAEREFVCGDLKELQLSTPAAAASILGLVIRRQLAAWLRWGPWLALLGIVGLTGCYLSGLVAHVQTGILLQIRTYLTYGVAYEPGGVTAVQQIVYASTAMIAVFLWFWASGFVLAAVSGRALWMTSLLFYVVVREGLFVRMALAGNIILKHGLVVTMFFRLLPLEPITVTCLLVLALGVRSARKGTLKQSTPILLSALGLTLVFLLAWMESWFPAGYAHWSGQPYDPTPFVYRVFPIVISAWPILSVPIFSKRLRACA